MPLSVSAAVAGARRDSRSKVRLSVDDGVTVNVRSMFRPCGGMLRRVSLQGKCLGHGAAMRVSIVEVVEARRALLEERRDGLEVLLGTDARGERRILARADGTHELRVRGAEQV